MTPTKKQLNLVTESKEFQYLVYNVFITTAQAQITREKVERYAVPLFQSMNFVEVGGNRGRTPGKAINHPENAYLSFDREHSNPLFDRYIDLLYDLHIKHGFKIEVKGQCPALIAEYTQLVAEVELLKYMEKAIGMPAWYGLDDRKKMIDLYLAIGADSAQKTKDLHFSN